MRIAYATPGYRASIFAGSVALHGLGLAVPLFMMQLYDRIIPNSSLATLAWLAAATILAIILETLLRILRFNLAFWHAERALFDCRRQITDIILRAPMTGKRLREAFPALQKLVHDSWQQMSFYVADIPFGLLYLALIFAIHPAAFAFIVGLGVVQVGLSAAIRPRYRRRAALREQLERQRSKLTAATFATLAELKALGAEEISLQFHQDVAARIRENERGLLFIEGVRGVSSRAVGLLAVFGPIVVGGAFVVEGSLTLGALTACVLLAQRALAPLGGLAERIVSQVDRDNARSVVTQVSPSGMMNEAEANWRRELPVAGPVRLELNNLIIRRGIDPALAANLALGARAPDLIDDDRVILRLPSASIDPGTLVYLPADLPLPAGELFKVLRGTNHYFSGEVLLDGHVLARYSRGAVGRRIVLLEERETLLPGSFLENIASFDPALQAQARDAAAMLGLDSFFQRLERGYETSVGDGSAITVSPSILQRLALARALALRPSILILDRFDASLDQQSVGMTRRALAAVAPLMTIIYRGSDPGYLPLAGLVAEARDLDLVLRRP